ncbi:energy transducer TonB [bacterium]|nr:energy transducer TonB [bacterium]
MKFLCLFFLLFPFFGLAQSDTLSYDSASSNTLQKVYDLLDVDEQATFNGAEPSSELRKFLAENIRYPDSARDDGLQGIVVVSFVINADSSISDIEIVTPKIGGGIEEEVIRIITASEGLWEPSMVDNKAVATKFMLPVNFQIFDDEGTKPKKKSKRKK